MMNYPNLIKVYPDINKSFNLVEEALLTLGFSEEKRDSKNNPYYEKDNKRYEIYDISRNRSGHFSFIILEEMEQ
jgi:hypothetical protein